MRCPCLIRTRNPLDVTRGAQHFRHTSSLLSAGRGSRCRCEVLSTWTAALCTTSWGCSAALKSTLERCSCARSAACRRCSFFAVRALRLRPNRPPQFSTASKSVVISSMARSPSTRWKTPRASYHVARGEVCWWYASKRLSTVFSLSSARRFSR